MPKLMSLITAKPEFTREGLIERYEHGHAILALKLVPFFSDYRRSFVVPGSVRQSAVGAPLVDFHVYNQMSFADAGKLERLGAALSGDVADAITMDESAFMVRERIFIVDVEEFVSPEQDLAVPPPRVRMPVVKMVTLTRRPPAMSRRQFRDAYEGDYVRAFIRNFGSRIAEFVRSYPSEDSPLRLPHLGEPHRELDFDVLEETWFWTREAYHQHQAAVSAQALPASGSPSLQDAGPTTSFLVDEHRTSAETLDVASRIHDLKPRLNQRSQ